MTKTMKKENLERDIIFTKQLAQPQILFLFFINKNLILLNNIIFLINEFLFKILPKINYY